MEKEKILFKIGDDRLSNKQFLAYKKNLNDTLNRLNEFYGGRGEGKIYAQMNVFSTFQKEYLSKNPPGERSYPDPNERIRVWDEFLKERQDIEDDSMPVCYLSEFDQGLYAGLVGGEIRFLQNEDTIWISSMVKPFFDDLRLIKDMKLDPGHIWYKNFQQQLRVFRDYARGKFGIGHFILIDSFNFLYELRGATRAYLDAEENPDLVKTVIDFAYQLNVWVMETFFEEISLFKGGTFSNFGQWIPGRVVSESVDPFHMTSVDYFLKWGKEPIEKIFSYFDGGLIHLHSNGRHLLKSVANLKGIKAILMANDIWNPPSITLLNEFNTLRDSVPLIVPTTYQDFINSLREHSLIGNAFYIIDEVPDILVANRLMEEVRNYRI